VWIKVDTGLGRLGVPFQAAPSSSEPITQETPLEIEGFRTLTENRSAIPSRSSVWFTCANGRSGQRPVEPAFQQTVSILPASYLDVVSRAPCLWALSERRERMDMALVLRPTYSPSHGKTRVGYLKTIPAASRLGRSPLTTHSRYAHAHSWWAGRRLPARHEQWRHVLSGTGSPSRRQRQQQDGGRKRPAVGAIGDEVVLLGRQGSEGNHAGRNRPAAGGVYRLLALFHVCAESLS